MNYNNDIGTNTRTQRRLNPLTLDTLSSNGANLGKIHKITNVFFGNGIADINRLSEKLANNLCDDCRFEKLDIEDSESNENRHTLEYSIDFIPSLENINNMTDLCVRLAHENNCEYDGWYTQPVE